MAIAAIYTVYWQIAREHVGLSKSWQKTW